MGEASAVKPLGLELRLFSAASIRCGVSVSTVDTGPLQCRCMFMSCARYATLRHQDDATPQARGRMTPAARQVLES